MLLVDKLHEKPINSLTYLYLSMEKTPCSSVKSRNLACCATALWYTLYLLGGFVSVVSPPPPANNEKMNAKKNIAVAFDPSFSCPGIKRIYTTVVEESTL